LARELAGPLRVAALVEESQRLATVDPLTLVMNRRAVLEALDAEISRACRHGRPYSVVLLDVDHFKQVNDRFGHATGDAVLAATGRLLRTLSRKGDLVARWGGEEFVVCLHATHPEGARIAAERIRGGIESMAVTDQEGRGIPVTASLGVVSLTKRDSVHALIDRADRAMYQAKAAGRNRVVQNADDAIVGETELMECGDRIAA
jgi:diguanylate cyclase (GGDEF)-like protein